MFACRTRLSIETELNFPFMPRSVLCKRPKPWMRMAELLTFLGHSYCAGGDFAQQLLIFGKSWMGLVGLQVDSEKWLVSSCHPKSLYRAGVVPNTRFEFQILVLFPTSSVIFFFNSTVPLFLICKMVFIPTLESVGGIKCDGINGV